MRSAWASVVVAITCQLFSGPAAFAQGAPVPIGYWTTADGMEQLLVQPNGDCSLTATNMGGFFGTCSWNPSSNGGILTMMNRTTYKPAPIYYNIIWLDQQTISCDGDVMYRRG